MKRLALAAIAAELLFLLLLSIADIGAGVPLDETVSELVHHDTAAIARASFAVHAISLALLAASVTGRARTALLAGVGGMVLVTAFDTDAAGAPTTWIGRVHLVGALFAFGGVAVAAALRWPRLKPLAIAVVASTLLVFAMAFVGGVPLGVVERFQAYLNGAWIIATAWASDFSSTSRSADT